MRGTAWQDLIAALVALTAGAWLLRRWLVKRRTKVGCDTCAASMHARLQSARPDRPKTPVR